MTTPSPRRAAVAAVVLGLLLTLVLTILPASTAPVLPRVRAPRLLASAIEALDTPQPLSGTVSVRVQVERRRGLVLAEQRDYRVWRSSAGVRIAQILDDGERLFVANGSTAWWWDSGAMSVTRLDAAEVADEGFDFAPALVGDPLAFARTLFGTIKRRSDISVEGTGVVAGRSAYILSVRSEQRRSSVRRIRIWVEARTRLPLRVQVWEGRRSPTIDVAFTRISFAAVDPDLFQFTRPAGTHVERLDLLRGRGHDGLVDHTQTFGRGWRTRVAFQLSTRLTDRAEELFPMVASFGSIATTHDRRHSWVLAGFVPLGRLERDIPRLT